MTGWTQEAGTNPTAWTTFGNGVEHTGYAPETIGTEPLVERWFAPETGTLNQVAVADGQVFVTPLSYFGESWLKSYDAATGALNWSYDFEECFSVNPPTYDDGHVYVQRGNHGSDTQLWSFRAETGVPFWISSHSAQWERYLAPVVADGKVFINGGYYGGMYGFDQANGQELFFRPLAQYDEWTPTFYGDELYSFVAGVFANHDQSSGAMISDVDLGWSWSGWSMGRTSATAMGRAYVIGNPNLYAIDLSSGTVEWSIVGPFRGTPAVANGVVYAIEGSFLKAYNAYDGTYLGVYVGGSTLLQQPLITHDKVVLPGQTETRVYDLDTFTLQQTIPHGGPLSLAGGVLYIAETGGVHAFDIPGAAPIADLVGEMEPWKPTTFNGESVLSSRTEISNLGDANTAGYSLEFFLSNDPYLHDFDQKLRALELPSLVPGDKIETEVLISSEFSISGRYLLMVLDGDEATPESNESNVFVATRFP